MRGVSILYEGVHKLYVGRQVVMIVEFTNQGEREKEIEQDPNLGMAQESMFQVQASSTSHILATAFLLDASPGVGVDRVETWKN
jgi:hypothetical protein